MDDNMDEEEHDMSRPYLPHDYDVDAEKLHLAIEKFTEKENEDFVVHVLCCTYPVFRNNIAVTYKRKYGRRLSEDIGTSTVDPQRKVLQAVLKPPHEYLRECVKNSIKLVPTELKNLIAFILTDKMRFGVDYCLKHEEDEDFTTLLPSSVSHDLRSLLTGLINKGFVVGDYPPDIGIAEDAKKLMKDFSSETLSELMVTTHTFRVGSILKEVEKQKGKSIDKIITSKIPESDLRDAFLLIGEFSKSATGFHVNFIRECIEKGDDDTLMRLLLLQRDGYMEDIQEKYEKKFGEKICAGNADRYGSAMITLATTHLPYMCIMCDYLKE